MPSLFMMKLIGIGVAVLMLGALIADRGRWMHRAHGAEAQNTAICAATRAASNRPTLDCKQTAVQVTFLGDALNAVQSKTAAAKAADEANKREVESRQNVSAKESSSAYQEQLARIRADYAKRLRDNGKSSSNLGGSGAKSVSGFASTPGRSGTTTAETGLPSEDALVCTEQAYQLQAILDWGKKVGVVTTVH